MPRPPSLLTALARAGFTDLKRAEESLDVAVPLLGVDYDELILLVESTADPDQALEAAIRLAADDVTLRLLRDRRTLGRFLLVAGASSGFVDHLLRHPDALAELSSPELALPSAEHCAARLLGSVGSKNGFAARVGDDGWNALRIEYRRLLLLVAAYDLGQHDPVEGLDAVADALTDLAAAALDASLAVARSQLSTRDQGVWFYPRGEVADTQLAVIGMGKAGARELNYVSDVDVIFVCSSADEEALDTGRALEIATRLAMLTMRGAGESGFEPRLWEVDPNLRPEGKSGALVRTLDSHLAYYERWAKGWEFQALLKAHTLAGDRELGARYEEAIKPLVWVSASRENFVEDVQRMRERVTAHIPAEEIDRQLKLGPGGLRDIEFTVQLLQLVHGQADPGIRQTATLPALRALAENGYIGRVEGTDFSRDYRVLRLLEHRMQLSRLQRTHLMPATEEGMRVLARASGLAGSGSALVARWDELKRRVRTLHERLFYRPLLAAVASMSEAELKLSSEQAAARLQAIGFQNPTGALAHIAALTSGVSRRATIQRHLLPVLLQWLAEGADPDYGLLAFRRLSDSLGETYWFLRSLRDGSGTGERLMKVLSGSRFVGELLERIPEAAAWLENDEDLRPRAFEVLTAESRSIIARHDTPDAVAAALRNARRREVLRLAIASILGVCTVQELAAGLTDVTTAELRGVLEAIRQAAVPAAGDGIEFAIIAMGRYGGAELGLGSDIDLMYVYRARGVDDDQTAPAVARFIADELARLTEDHRLPLDFDTGLRPEGKNGPLVRSLDSYRAYYARWSLTWEAQALLRARGVAGDPELIADFEKMADDVRYPAAISERDVREVKRLKARVEAERLPQGADPTRHLKLGRGSLSDVEWFVQLLQLQHGSRFEDLRTTSTLEALDAAERHDLVSRTDAELLRSAWMFASRARSAITLWSNRTTDVLPTDRRQREGVARILDYPPGSATELEEDYLAVTRRSRAVFERAFYGSAG